MSIFDPGKAEAFARQNEKNLREHLRSMTVERSVAIMEDLIRSGIRSGFRRRREGDPLPVAICKRMERTNGAR